MVCPLGNGHEILIHVHNYLYELVKEFSFMYIIVWINFLAFSHHWSLQVVICYFSALLIARTRHAIIYKVCSAMVSKETSWTSMKHYTTWYKFSPIPTITAINSSKHSCILQKTMKLSGSWAYYCQLNNKEKPPICQHSATPFTCYID